MPGRIRPVPVAALGGLAGAALSAAGLSLFHHLDAALMVLIWHGGSTSLVVAGFMLAGRRWRDREDAALHRRLRGPGAQGGFIRP